MSGRQQRAYVETPGEHVAKRTVLSPPRSERHAPHVVLVVLGGTDREQLACFGGPTRTPVLDRLAREGIRYASAPDAPCAGGTEEHEQVKQYMSRLGYVGFRAASAELGGTSLPTHTGSQLAAELRVSCVPFVGLQRVGDLSLGFVARTLRKAPGQSLFLRLDLDLSAGEASVLQADEQLGRVLRAFERNRVLEQTLMMVVLARPGLGEEVLLVRWPERIAARGETRLRAAHPWAMLAKLLGATASGRRRRRRPVSDPALDANLRRVGPDTRKYVYYPARAGVPQALPTALLGRPHRISAAVVTARDAQGTVICQASVCGGYALYIENRRVHYVHTYLGGRTLRLRARELLPNGRAEVRLEFKPERAADVASGRRTPGRVRLLVAGRVQAHADLPLAMPLLLALGGGSTVGRPGDAEIARLYEHAPFASGHELGKVVVELGAELRIDARAEMRAVTERQCP